jgi:hypothetical protein
VGGGAGGGGGGGGGPAGDEGDEGDEGNEGDEAAEPREPDEAAAFAGARLGDRELATAAKAAWLASPMGATTAPGGGAGGGGGPAGSRTIRWTGRGPRAQTSGQLPNRPSQTTWHSGQLQDVGPACIGWSHPSRIWHPNSWHQPMAGIC